MKVSIIPVLILIFITIHSFPDDRTNLIINPGFENNQEGWEDMWVREKGKGTMKISSLTGKAGGMVLQVAYSGTQDWSIGQKSTIDVIPGEVYAFYGWVQCKEIQKSAQLSVVLRDSQDKVMKWDHGLKETSGTHGWKRMEGRFMIPNGCARIQFRITGYGKGVSTWDDLYMVKIKQSSGVISPGMKEISMTHLGTTLTYSTGTGIFRLQSEGHSGKYLFRGFDNSVFFKDIKKNGNSLLFSIQNIYSGDITASVTIPAHNTVSLLLKGNGIMDTDFSFPARLDADASQGWVIPNNEGLLIPADDPYYLPLWKFDLYQGHGGLSMPFIGLTGEKEGIIFISETPDDNYVQFHPPEKSGTNTSGWTFGWEPEMGSWGYERRIRILLIDRDGYVGIARAYRNYAREKGLLVTLQQKRESVPAVDLLIGAANIWMWEKAEWWSSLPDCRAIAQELKNAGFVKVLWSNGASPVALKRLNDLGFLTGRYDIYQDVWDPAVPFQWLNKRGWPEDLVLDRDGSWRQGWVHRENGKEYPGGIICSRRGYERMKKDVAEELKTFPYRARFIDTTTASPLYECYNPLHPLSRSGDREYKSKLLGYISGEFHLVTGSETGIDWAVPYVHYFEGMMSIGRYRLEDAGYDLASIRTPQEDFLRFQLGFYYRIPLFELVYHDCVVSFWYWGDSSNRLPQFWQTRDLFNLLYGTGPLYIMDPERWKKNKERFIESYHTATQISLHSGYAEMLSHRFITEDHTVQYTRFNNGTGVWVNFGEKPFTLENGKKIEPAGYVIEWND
ncbi:MAG: carbohydrate binding domain-containing protein [Spirochaetales bacterium]|nr:carbohydrate binding domain-containing protein [Spirochaetales bacterium]